MRRIQWKISGILNILRWICYISCIILGAFAGPTWMAACLFAIAILLTPSCVAEFFLETPGIRLLLLICACMALLFTPMRDVRQAMEYALMKLQACSDFFRSLAAWFQS